MTVVAASSQYSVIQGFVPLLARPQEMGYTGYQGGPTGSVSPPEHVARYPNQTVSEAGSILGSELVNWH